MVLHISAHRWASKELSLSLSPSLWHTFASLLIWRVVAVNVRQQWGCTTTTKCCCWIAGSLCTCRNTWISVLQAQYLWWRWLICPPVWWRSPGKVNTTQSGPGAASGEPRYRNWQDIKTVILSFTTTSNPPDILTPGAVQSRLLLTQETHRHPRPHWEIAGAERLCWPDNFVIRALHSTLR